MIATSEHLRDGKSFDDEMFVGLDLADANLGDKVFANCTFRNLKLQQSRWDRARLVDCVFDACDLTRLAPAGMAGVRFERCDLGP